MERKVMENIEKVPMYKEKIEKIYSSLRKNNLKDGYIAIIAIIEAILVVLLKKVYNENVETTSLAVLSKLLLIHDEKVIAEEIIFINSNREDDEFMEFIDEMDIEYISERLDYIIKIILEKHGDIFKK